MVSAGAWRQLSLPGVNHLVATLWRGPGVGNEKDGVCAECLRQWLFANLKGGILAIRAGAYQLSISVNISFSVLKPTKKRRYRKWKLRY